MKSSNRDLETNVTSLVCRRGVRGSCYNLRRVFLSTLALEKIVMALLCCLDWMTSKEYG